MSTIIIGGGGGHNAVDLLVGVYPEATAAQQAAIKAMLEKFVSDADAMAKQVRKNRT